MQANPELKTAMARGFLGRCPCCGKGHVFRAFLKVADRCDVCGEEFFHHKADDFPAYLVIVIVGHLVVATLLATAQLLSVWTALAIFIPLTIFLSLALLQPVKGAVVALQWDLGMHGFAEAKRARTCEFSLPH